jgi:hypothetical protein
LGWAVDQQQQQQQQSGGLTKKVSQVADLVGAQNAADN